MASSRPFSESSWRVSALVFYLPVTVVALGIMLWRAGLQGTVARLVGDAVFRDLALGAATGALASAITIGLAAVSSTARDMETGLRDLLGPLRVRDCLALAAASGVGEELLFRAALQPEFGLVVTSVLFGLVHVPLERRLLAWPFLAAGMGLVLGGLYIHTGAVLAPAMAHATVNALNLWRLGRPRDSQGELPSP